MTQTVHPHYDFPEIAPPPPPKRKLYLFYKLAAPHAAQLISPSLSHRVTYSAYEFKSSQELDERRW